MKKRDSIFSNGSIHGFNSALYLASEFNADSDSDTWIPINECCSDLNKSVLSNASKFQDEPSGKYSQKADQQIDIINKTLQSKLKFDKISSENSNPWKRRLSTPLNIKGSIYSNHCMQKEGFNEPIAEESFSNLIENESTNMTANIIQNNVASCQGTSTNLLNVSQAGDSSSLQAPTIYYSPTKMSMLNPCIANYISNQPVTMNTMVLLNLIKEKQAKLVKPDTSIISSVTTNTTKDNKSDKKKSKKKNNQPREGDWTCKECQNLNFSFRITCNKCTYVKVNDAGTN